MNESTRSLIVNQMSNLKSSGVQLLTWDQAVKSPDFRELGQNRGLRVRFDVDDIIHFPPLNEAVFFTTQFASGDKSYSVLKTLAVIESKKYGSYVKEIPAAVFCRVPSLPKEEEILWQDNQLGFQLANASADYIRLQMCCEAGDIRVTWASGQNGAENLHTDRWYTDKDTKERVRVADSEDAVERATIRCYKYTKVA